MMTSRWFGLVLLGGLAACSSGTSAPPGHSGAAGRGGSTSVAGSAGTGGTSVASAGAGASNAAGANGGTDAAGGATGSGGNVNAAGTAGNAQAGAFSGLDPNDLLAGFRNSSYGPKEWAEAHNTTFTPDAAYWSKVAESMAGRFDAAKPGGIFIVGELATDNGCNLKFPALGKTADAVHFAAKDDVESVLTHFDTRGVKVWLQVESGDADMPTLIDIVLQRYHQHPSVVGFGIDVEWYQESTHKGEGKEVTDAEAKAWLTRVRSYNPHYTLMLKHWLSAKMPKTLREGLLFVNDGQNVPDMNTLLSAFKSWGAHFASSPVGFQIGYETDKAWWSKLNDPPKTLGAAILDAVPNTRALFWVDFTVADVIPPQ